MPKKSKALLMMRAAKLSWAVAGAGKEQGWRRSWTEAETGQDWVGAGRQVGRSRGRRRSRAEG